MPANYEWLVWSLLSAFFAALTAIFAKLGIKEIDSDLATLYRTWVVVILLFLIVLYSGKWKSPFDVNVGTWGYLLLSGLATGLSWVCYFRALKVGDVSRVAPVDKLSVVLVAVLAILFLGERPSSRDWGGILLIASGVIVLSLKK